jgi:thiamine pyrophosphate-dependent acetolactate synthase large subunit-like protein
MLATDSLPHVGRIGGTGYAPPAALGAKFAAPGRPSVAVCGDGGFAMTMNALLTAAHYRIPVTTVVLNNGAPFRQVQSPLAKEGPGGE